MPTITTEPTLFVCVSERWASDGSEPGTIEDWLDAFEDAFGTTPDLVIDWEGDVEVWRDRGSREVILRAVES